MLSEASAAELSARLSQAEAARVEHMARTVEANALAIAKKLEQQDAARAERFKSEVEAKARALDSKLAQQDVATRSSVAIPARCRPSWRIASRPSRPLHAPSRPSGMTARWSFVAVRKK